MTTQSLTRPRPARDFAHLKPLPDPPRLPDAMLQHKHMTRADQTLETWFRHRRDAMVGGNGYLCWNRTDPRNTWLAPDCLVSLNVDPEHAMVSNSYIINEVGKSPDFVMEVATRSTGRRDYTIKRDQYAAFGVGEYWRFDPSGGEYHDRPLAGEYLVAGQYESYQIHQDADGMLWGHSPLLGLDLCWREGELFFRNPATGDFLLRASQTQDALDAARDELMVTQDAVTIAETRATNMEALADAIQTRAANAESRADDAESQAADARLQAADAESRADDAESRAADAEAEAERLREMLRRLQPDADDSGADPPPP